MLEHCKRSLEDFLWYDIGTSVEKLSNLPFSNHHSIACKHKTVDTGYVCTFSILGFLVFIQDSGKVTRSRGDWLWAFCSDKLPGCTLASVLLTVPTFTCCFPMENYGSGWSARCLLCCGTGEPQRELDSGRADASKVAQCGSCFAVALCRERRLSHYTALFGEGGSRTIQPCLGEGGSRTITLCLALYSWSHT